MPHTLSPGLTSTARVQVFGYIRDLAILRCDGLSAKELILLRMVAAAPTAADMTEKQGKKTGQKILGSLLDLAEVFLREFYQLTVVPQVSSPEDYETAASACTQRASRPPAVPPPLLTGGHEPMHVARRPMDRPEHLHRTSERIYEGESAGRDPRGRRAAL